MEYLHNGLIAETAPANDFSVEQKSFSYRSIYVQVDKAKPFRSIVWLAIIKIMEGLLFIT
jgi:hypothetical protein